MSISTCYVICSTKSLILIIVYQIILKCKSLKFIFEFSKPDLLYLLKLKSLIIHKVLAPFTF